MLVPRWPEAGFHSWSPIGAVYEAHVSEAGKFPRRLEAAGIDDAVLNDRQALDRPAKRGGPARRQDASDK